MFLGVPCSFCSFALPRGFSWFLSIRESFRGERSSVIDWQVLCIFLLYLFLVSSTERFNAPVHRSASVCWPISGSVAWVVLIEDLIEIKGTTYTHSSEFHAYIRYITSSYPAPHYSHRTKDFRRKASQPGYVMLWLHGERGLREVSVRSNVRASSSKWRNGWQTFICSSSVPTIIQERERESVCVWERECVRGFSQRFLTALTSEAPESRSCEACGAVSVKTLL